MSITNHIQPDFKEAISANFGYGLDVKNPHEIIYSKDNITIEVIGGITDPVAQNLRVTLKIYKKGTINPLEIYRSTQVDLFNETQTNFVATQVSERLNIESLTFKHIFYDFIERIDNYRKHGRDKPTPNIPIPVSVQTEVKKILQSKNILESLKLVLEQAGISDTRLGIQLFIISLSRITKYPLHGIIQAPKLLGNTLITEFLSILPQEQTIELTSISKHALSYAPTEDYWNNKTLVLHQLESIKNKGNSLLEYLVHGKSLRLVTQIDSQTGVYHSEQKNVTSSINLLGYSNEEQHPLFNGKNTICIPVGNISKLKETLYSQEIKELAGLINIEKREEAQNVLQQLVREIKDYHIYNPIMEQIDVSSFFGNNPKEISKYLKLVNLITLLHQYKQNPKLTKTQAQLEVKKEYMILALEYFKEVWVPEDEELCFRVASTFLRLKKLLRKKFPSDFQIQTFKQKEIRKELGMSPATLSRHINTLDQYGKIEKTAGNKKHGFEYTIKNTGTA